MNTGDIGEVTVDGKDYRGSNDIRFIGSADYQGRLCGKGVRRRIAMGKATVGGLTSLWKDAGDEGETSETFCVPDCSKRSGLGQLRKHERRKIDAFELVVVLEKRTESIVAGEKDNHMDHREH